MDPGTWSTDRGCMQPADQCPCCHTARASPCVRGMPSLSLQLGRSVECECQGCTSPSASKSIQGAEILNPPFITPHSPMPAWMHQHHAPVHALLCTRTHCDTQVPADRRDAAGAAASSGRGGQERQLRPCRPRSDSLDGPEERGRVPHHAADAVSHCSGAEGAGDLLCQLQVGWPLLLFGNVSGCS